MVDGCQPCLTPARFLQSLGLTAACRSPQKMGGREDDGSLTLQDLLRVMIGATAGLLGLKLCTKGGLLPFASLPLTQACHVDTLQPDKGGVPTYRI